MLQAAPVSTKQCACDAESVWKNVRLLGSVWGDCAILGPLEISFASLEKVCLQSWATVPKRLW